LRFSFEDFVLDRQVRELRQGGELVPVEPKVFDLLVYLIEQRDRVVTKDELIATVWQGRIVSESALASAMNAARVAVGDSGEAQRLIKTFPRKGIRFVGALLAGASHPRPTTEASRPNNAALALPDKPSIAVLPFRNMSSDPEQEYFADGIVEDIIAGLARIKWLFVISRNSSFVYKAQQANTKQVGHELGVRYVLEGSVRKSGQQLRIATQLSDAESGAVIWVERYDAKLDDIFALQDQISERVIAAIEPNLRSAELNRVRRQRPRSLDAYDLVLRASPFAHTHVAEDAAIAIPLLTKALNIEPDYAAAHAPLALCYHSRFSRAGLREEDRGAAIRHARAAMAFGTDDAAALGIAGFVIALDAHDREAALRAFDQALAISNSDFFALCSSALTLSWMGTSDVAIDRANRALRLSPFDPLNFVSCNALAISYLHLREFGRAYEAATRSVQTNPRFSVSRAFLTAALVQLGRGDEAKREARQVLALDPTFSIKRFSVTVDIEPSVFAPIAQAWKQAGLPLG
jgi:TolB-like protein